MSWGATSRIYDSRDTLFADARGGVSESKRREKGGGFYQLEQKQSAKREMKRGEEREDEVMLIIMEELMTICIYYYFMPTRSPPKAPFPKFCVTFSTTLSLNCHFSGKFSLENFKTFGHTCSLRYGFTCSKCTFCIFSPKIIQTIATVSRSKHCVNTIVNHGCASKYRSIFRE